MNTTVEDERIIGPLGSVFHRIKVNPDLIPDFAQLDWNTLGKRVMIDAKEGIIAWMSPSKTHEITSRATDKIVDQTGIVLRKKTVDLGGTRWGKPEDPKNIGVEADASYYIGKKADGWITAFEAGGFDEAERFTATTPPDLVVEVEVTNRDEGKPAKYARLGIREMWQVKSRSGEVMFQPEVTILDLMADGGQCEVAQSQVLPGLQASTLPRAYELVAKSRHADLQSLLKKNIIPSQ